MRTYNSKKHQTWRKSASVFKRNRGYSRRQISEHFNKSIKFNWQSKVLIYFLLFIFFYIIYFLFFSNYFKIDQIVVNGNQDISTQEIIDKSQQILNKRRLLFFKNNNYFTFNIEEIEEILAKDYLFESLEVEKKYYSTIEINLKEKNYKVFYLMGEDIFLIDQEGMVISHLEEMPDTENQIIIKEIPQEVIINQEEINEQEKKIVRDHPVYQSTNSTSTVYVWQESDQGMIVKEEDLIQPISREIYPDLLEVEDYLFDHKVLENILDLDYNYRERFNYPRKYYQYQQDQPNFLILVTDNFKIYFKIKEDITSQISNLYRYLVEEGKELLEIEYIDLRQKDQIIIK